MHSTAVGNTPDTSTRPRRVGRRVVLVLATLLPGLLTIGAVEALVGDADGGVHRFHHVTHLVWLGLLVWVPYLLQWHRPQDKVAPWQAAAASAAVFVVAGVSTGIGDDPVFVAAFALLALLVWATHPARGRLLTTGPGLSPVLAPLAAIAAIPASLYAVDQLALQGSAADDVHGALLHYASQGATVLFVVAFAVVASLRTSGWQWVAGLATAAGVVLGVSSLLDPAQAGAWSTGGSLSVLLLALGYGAAAVWEHRRGNPASAAQGRD